MYQRNEIDPIYEKSTFIRLPPGCDENNKPDPNDCPDQDRAPYICCVCDEWDLFKLGMCCGPCLVTCLSGNVIGCIICVFGWCPFCFNNDNCLSGHWECCYQFPP